MLVDVGRSDPVGSASGCLSRLAHGTCHSAASTATGAPRRACRFRRSSVADFVGRPVLTHPGARPTSWLVPRFATGYTWKTVARQGSGGYFTVARFGAAPVRLHWTTPLGAFFFCGVFLGTAYAPAGWAAFLVLILVHELGHAVLARRFGLRVVSVDLHGLGGMCRLSGETSDLRRAQIAWGGVGAQALLLVATALLAPTNASSPAIAQIVQTWTGVNVLIIAFNLLPFGGLDGAEAWMLFRWRNVRRFGRRTALEGKRRKLEEELARVEREATARTKGEDRSMLN